jgi:kinesin family protein 11
LEEAKKINVSIASLGNCINALANNASMLHVPFRDSKLTRILTECLGYIFIKIRGNSKTAICACISPYAMNYEETLTTLQFASRAIKIKVEAKVNEKIEMRKVKENLMDFKNLKTIHADNRKSDKETNESKNSLNNLRNDLKVRSKSQVFDDNSISNNNSDNELLLKFQTIILHLQNELSKNVKFILYRLLVYITSKKN